MTARSHIRACQHEDDETASLAFQSIDVEIQTVCIRRVNEYDAKAVRMVYKCSFESNHTTL